MKRGDASFTASGEVDGAAFIPLVRSESRTGEDVFSPHAGQRLAEQIGERGGLPVRLEERFKTGRPFSSLQFAEATQVHGQHGFTRAGEGFERATLAGFRLLAVFVQVEP